MQAQFWLINDDSSRGEGCKSAVARQMNRIVPSEN